MKNKSVRPGIYPKRYRCVECHRELNTKEMLTTRARDLGNSECVCAPCIPKREKRMASPVRNIAETGLLESIALACAAVWVKLRKASGRKEQDTKKAMPDTKEVVSSFLDAAIEYPEMRSELLTIARLDDFHRDRMLDPIIARLYSRKAPEELLKFVTSLKNREIAECVRKILETA